MGQNPHYIVNQAFIGRPSLMITTTEKQDIRKLSREEIADFLEEVGEQKFRAKQIDHWLWKKSVVEFKAMKNLPKSLLEKLVDRVPLLSWIYSSIRKLTSLFYEGDGQSRFKRVVMVEYPRKGMYVIAFATNEAMEELNTKTKKKLISVFLPTTPNPTSGFLLMVPKEDLIPLEMSTEDAVKLIVSAGMSTPESGA